MATILVVDDRPTNRQLLFTLLGYVGHKVVEAADGAEGLSQVRQHHPDLVITDILMPIMSGYDFVQQMRADPAVSHTPVIFHTASYSEPQAQKLADASGVRVVLPKPCEPEKLLAAVNSVLGLQKSSLVPEIAQQQVALAAREVMLAENMLAGYLRDLNAVRDGFTDIIESNPHSSADQQQKLALTDTFSRTIAGLTLMTVRLSALVQAGLDLLQNRDAAQIVSRCFDAACRVMGSSYAAICLFNQQDNTIQFLFTKGIDEKLYRAEHGMALPLVTALLEQQHAIRICVTGTDQLSGLPVGHPQVRNFLGVPIATNDQTYGWMYFADRLGADEFTDDDERVAVTLALQLALLHENFLLYDLLQNRAVQLQLEITERRQVERQLIQLNESLESRVAERTAELQQANKELEAYSYSVSHDLRAPLITIGGFTKLLLHDHAQTQGGSAEQLTFLQHIDGAVLRTMSIIDALLRLSQLSRQALEKATINIVQLTQEVVIELRQREPGRSIEVEVQALPDCIGDTFMIRQLLINLLSNAFKFTRNQPAAKIVIGWRPLDTGGAYFVSDNGVGFKPHHAERLFAAFQRDHSEVEFEGTGIGLSIAQRIVQRHGGRIWAESHPGAGALFYFTLG